MQARNKLSMVQAINVNDLGSEFGVLRSYPLDYCIAFVMDIIVTYRSIDHIQNFGLHKLEILSVTSRGSANNIVNLDVVIFTTYSS